jgi:hypothetical protein
MNKKDYMESFDLVCIEINKKLSKYIHNNDNDSFHYALGISLGWHFLAIKSKWYEDEHDDLLNSFIKNALKKERINGG